MILLLFLVFCCFVCLFFWGSGLLSGREHCYLLLALSHGNVISVRWKCTETFKYILESMCRIQWIMKNSKHNIRKEITGTSISLSNCWAPCFERSLGLWNELYVIAFSSVLSDHCFRWFRVQNVKREPLRHVRVLRDLTVRTGTT